MDRQFAAKGVSFNLTRRFSLLSFLCVVAVAGILGQALARMVSDRLLHRDAVLTMEFVQSVVRMTRAKCTATGPTSEPSSNLR